MGLDPIFNRDGGETWHDKSPWGVTLNRIKRKRKYMSSLPPFHMLNSYGHALWLWGWYVLCMVRGAYIVQKGRNADGVIG